MLDADEVCKEAIRKLQSYASLKGVKVPSSSTARRCSRDILVFLKGISRLCRCDGSEGRVNPALFCIGIRDGIR